MKDKGTILIILLLFGFIFATSKPKKRRGSVEIGPLDKGEFLPDYISDEEKINYDI